MTQGSSSTKRILEKLSAGNDVDSVAEKLSPCSPEIRPLPPRIPAGNNLSADTVRKRQEFLKAQGLSTDALAASLGKADPETLKGNIENLVGCAAIPVGIIGPLRINGLNANGDFYVPMATSEGALIASYHRGAYLLSQSGGASALCLEESIMRAPCFIFSSVVEASRFIAWAFQQRDSFDALIASRSKHAKLLDLETSLNGRTVFLSFKYFTGDAAGQNMVTIATEAVCSFLVENAPVKPEKWFLESNLSGDKKASMQSFINTRGKKVIAEAVIGGELISRLLHSSAKDMELYCKTSTQGGILSGTIGAQGHYANALAGLFIACGQDAACVAESSVGLTDMQARDDGSLYVSVSLPSLTVGTIGGGTGLPTARECLAILGCLDEGCAPKFAEICAATVLAGEISIIGSLSAGDFGTAHAKYRKKN